MPSPSPSPFQGLLRVVESALAGQHSQDSWVDVEPPKTGDVEACFLVHRLERL